MTVTPEQFNQLVTKDDLKNIKEDVNEIKKDVRTILRVLDGVVKE
jgi:hypothetical protein